MDGWLQGYNAQAAANEQQIVLAAEVMVTSPDFGHEEQAPGGSRPDAAPLPHPREAAATG